VASDWTVLLLGKRTDERKTMIEQHAGRVGGQGSVFGREGETQSAGRGAPRISRLRGGGGGFNLKTSSKGRCLDIEKILKKK